MEFIFTNFAFRGNNFLKTKIMEHKIRFYVKNKKKKIQKTITLHFIRTLRGLSVSTGKHPEHEIAFLRESEQKGLITNVTWIESEVSRNIDDAIREALLYLHSKQAKYLCCNIQKKYDYAWVKMALDHGKIPMRFHALKDMSAPKFYEYIISLGFYDIAGPKTLNKMIASAQWYPNAMQLHFPYSLNNIKEFRRRNNIVSKFLEYINEK